MFQPPAFLYADTDVLLHRILQIIANDLNSIDVDKWDYFSRDCHMLGLQHNFQCERTIKLAKVVEHDGKWHICFPKSVFFSFYDTGYWIFAWRSIFSCYVSYLKTKTLALNCNISLKEWFNLFDMYYTRFTLHRRAYQHLSLIHI